MPTKYDLILERIVARSPELAAGPDRCQSRRITDLFPCQGEASDGHYFRGESKDMESMQQIVGVANFAGYGLTTARILYRMPDHRDILQTYVWQDYDLAPKFPALLRFLAFWEAKLEGPLHSVAISHHRLLTPVDLRLADAEFAIN
jgi:uncharacterized protein Usg